MRDEVIILYYVFLLNSIMSQEAQDLIFKLIDKNEIMKYRWESTRAEIANATLKHMGISQTV